MRMDPESQMGLMMSRYVDNEVSTAEREMVEKHLETCPSCRDVLQIFRRNDELLKGAMNVEVFGNQIVERVMRQVEGKPAKTSKIADFWSRPAWAAIAAALIIVALGAVLIIQNSLVETMTTRMATVNRQMEQMREEMVRADHEMRNQLAVSDAVQKFERGAGKGVLASPLTGQIHLTFKMGNGAVARYQIFRRPTGASDWGTPIAATANREFTDTGVQAGKAYEYRVIAFDGRDNPVDQAVVPATLPDVYAIIQDPSHCLKIIFLSFDAQGASVMVQRVIHGQARHQIYQVKIGQELGSRVPDITGTDMIDFSTGHQIAAIEDADQTVSVTSTGNHFTRATKNLVLRPVGRPNGPGKVECLLGEATAVPLPK